MTELKLWRLLFGHQHGKSVFVYCAGYAYAKTVHRHHENRPRFYASIQSVAFVTLRTPGFNKPTIL
jgi:hypothetical protein